MKPITHAERSQSSQKRAQMVLELIQHRFLDPEMLLAIRHHAGIRFEGEYRPLFFSEAGAFSKSHIPQVSAGGIGGRRY
jgi:hypothetical protein